MCIMTIEIISNIIESNGKHNELFLTMSVLSTIYDLTILFNICNIAPHNKHNNPIFT